MTDTWTIRHKELNKWFNSLSPKERDYLFNYNDNFCRKCEEVNKHPENLTWIENHMEANTLVLPTTLLILSKEDIKKRLREFSLIKYMESLIK